MARPLKFRKCSEKTPQSYIPVMLRDEEGKESSGWWDGSKWIAHRKIGKPVEWATIQREGYVNGRSSLDPKPAKLIKRLNK